MTGRSPLGRAWAPSGLSQSSLSQAEPLVPNADSLKYAFFTPYHRGFDLVFDFVTHQPNRRFEHGLWRIEAAYGYERARDTKVFVEEQYVGTAHSIIERFARIAPVYCDFMHLVEDAANKWAAEKQAAEQSAAQQLRRSDEALCERVLAASAIPSRRADDAEGGSAGTEGSAVAKPDAQGPHHD